MPVGFNQNLLQKLILTNDVIFAMSRLYFLVCDNVTGGSNFAHSFFFDTES